MDGAEGRCCRTLTFGAIVLVAAVGTAAQPFAQRLQLVEGGSLMSSLPVPRQAIFARLKLGQRQMRSGGFSSARRTLWSCGPPETKNPPQGRVRLG